ncbi:MAG: hypothetical protein H7288_02400 [Kineosporiaceae bacterium]|nr:hypothetical protein [Aeromicrobium sp.]
MFRSTSPVITAPRRPIAVTAAMLCLALVAGFLMVATGAVAPSPAEATVRPAATKTVSLEGTFKTTDQSLWDPAAAAPSSTQRVSLFDESWDASASGGNVEEVDAEPLGTWDFGARGQVSSSGRVGMSLDLEGMSGGKVGVTYPVKVDVTMPADKTFGAGDTVEIATAPAEVQSGAEIKTTEPNISGVALNATFGLHAAFGGDICVFGCFGGGGDLVNFDEESGKIFGVSTDQIRNPTNTSPADTYCFGSAENSLFGLKSYSSATRCPGDKGYVARPNPVVNTTAQSDGSLTGVGEDTFAVIPVGAITWLQRLAGESVPINGSTGFSDLNVSWTGLDLNLNTAASRREELHFKPKVDVTLALPRALSYKVVTPGGAEVTSGRGTSVTLRSGNKVLVDVPTDQTVPFSATPTLSLAEHNLSNHVTHKIKGLGDLKMLAASLSLPGFSVGAIDIWDGVSFGIGPVYRKELELGTTTINVVPERTWSLGGFNSLVAATLTLAPAPPPVVTPVTIKPVEGAEFTSTVATFTDEVTKAVPADYVARITWGDGRASAGKITGSGGAYAIAGTHTYEQYGPYPIEVDLRTVPEGQLATNHVVTDTSATVSDAALTGVGAINNKTASGQDVLTWPNPSPAAPGDRVATFSDANPFGLLSDLSATIAWGDGTAPTTGVVTGGVGGPFAVAGKHDYTDLGLHTVTVVMTSKGGSTATTRTTTLSYTNPARGTFLLGGKKAVGAVTFWGSKWMKANALTSTTTSSFKGFASKLPPSCGSTWSGSAATGNSSVPPTTVPTYMAVAVTNGVNVAGTTVTGKTDAVVVVRTNAGYGPDPSRTGTGAVVAVLCGKVG